MNYIILLKPYIKEKELSILKKRIGQISPLYILNSLSYFYKSIKYINGPPYILFICCVILSIKYLSDSAYSLQEWSKLTNVSIPELIQTEIRLLKFLKYNLKTDYQEFQKIKQLYNK